MQITIPDSYVPYLVLLFNTLVFHFLRRVFLAVTPTRAALVIAEIIATLELCTGCAELGVAYEVHGYAGLGGGLLLICIWWCSVWGDAEACPCGPLEEGIFGVGIDATAIKKLVGQAIGGAFASTYAMIIWSYHMTPEHHALHAAAECQAGLQVNMFYGAIIEGLITLISRVVALLSVDWPTNLSIAANSVATTILVLAATSTTGGFFNPVLATALTLGCEGNTWIEHFTVYWIGALIGGFIGRYIYEIIKRRRKEKQY